MNYTCQSHNWLQGALTCPVGEFVRGAAVEVTRRAALGGSECWRCHGGGWLKDFGPFGDEECDVCEGTGTVYSIETEKSMASKEWADHCAAVRVREDARRLVDRGHTRIGAHYVPPPAPIQGCVEMPTESKPDPGKWAQVIIGFLMVSGFMTLAFVL